MPEMRGGRRWAAALALAVLAAATACSDHTAEGVRVDEPSTVGDCLAPAGAGPDGEGPPGDAAGPAGGGGATTDGEAATDDAEAPGGAAAAGGAGPDGAGGGTAYGAGYVPAACDDPAATVEVVDVTGEGSDERVEGFRRCPPGTDVVATGRAGLHLDGSVLGAPRTWCLRNLSAPHPGDPGNGGGELIDGDCFSTAEDGGITEVPCAGAAPGTPGTPTPTTTPAGAATTTPPVAPAATPPGDATTTRTTAPPGAAGPDRYWLLALAAEAVACPPGTTEPIELDEAPEPDVLCSVPV